MTAIQPETGAPSAAALSGTVSDAVCPASIVTVCFTEPKSLSSSTACSPGERSATVAGDVPRDDAIDADARACRIRPDVQLTDRRRAFRQIDVLRQLPACGDRDRHGARFAVAAQLHRMRAGLQRDGQRRQPALDAVHEDMSASGVGRDVQRPITRGGRRRRGVAARRGNAAASQSDQHRGGGRQLQILARHPRFRMFAAAATIPGLLTATASPSGRREARAADRARRQPARLAGSHSRLAGGGRGHRNGGRERQSRRSQLPGVTGAAA